MYCYAERLYATTYKTGLASEVKPWRARFGAWYEMFPRSTSLERGRHGTFKDCEARLPYVAGMGFDILYLPPIHPIGRTFRKGKNNSLTPEPDDVGMGSALHGSPGTPPHTAEVSRPIPGMQTPGPSAAPGEHPLQEPQAAPDQRGANLRRRAGFTFCCPHAGIVSGSGSLAACCVARS